MHLEHRNHVQSVACTCDDQYGASASSRVTSIGISLITSRTTSYGTSRTISVGAGLISIGAGRMSTAVAPCDDVPSMWSGASTMLYRQRVRLLGRTRGPRLTLHLRRRLPQRIVDSAGLTPVDRWKSEGFTPVNR